MLLSVFNQLLSGIFPRKPISQLQLICATRLSKEVFWRESPLGISYTKLFSNRSNIALTPEYNNKSGLPQVYNRLSSSVPLGSGIVFLHDDVWLEDDQIPEQLMKALNQFDLVGVAGNVRLTPNQPAWLFSTINAQGEFIWDYQNLRGQIRHGNPNEFTLSIYGVTPCRCAVIDGVFMAIRADTLKKSRIKFDERFSFHFYDMDFCRTAIQKKIKIGVYPLDIIHQSPGAFGVDQWGSGYRAYLSKWTV